MLYSFFGLLVCQLSIIKYCSLKNIISYTKFIVNYHINSCNKCYLLGCRNSFILISYFYHFLCSIGKWEWNLVKKFALVEQEFCEGDDRKIAHYPPPSTAMCLFLLSHTDADACSCLCVGEVSVFHGHHGVDNWCRTINSWTGLIPGSQSSHRKAKKKLNRSFLLCAEGISSTLSHQEFFSGYLIKELATCLVLFYPSWHSQSQWTIWSGNLNITSHCSLTLTLQRSVASVWFLNIRVTLLS